MRDYQKDFLKLCIDHGVLRFGEFTLKSGRVSPYFFNAGLFHSGAALSALARFYAQAIVDSGVPFDMLFGPAYKGIPLASVTALALNDLHGIDSPVAYNRKEVKTHGEGGQVVGAEIKGRVLIIDDVITAGTAVREAVDLISHAGATPCAISIALDRQEKGKHELSAIQELEKDYDLKVVTIVTLEDLLCFVQDDAELSRHFAAVTAYRDRYGVVSV